MPARIGSYTLGRVIGRGGNATVYAARQETSLGPSRLVALKILHHEGPALRREAELAMRLEHPNIVRTYDVGEHQGQLYLAMELVLGASLAKVMKAPLPLPLFTRIFVDIARAAHHAHELRSEQGEALGLVHQDLTPENVMLGYDGRVTLLDFGVARLALVDASRTDTVRGKPGYLSPEQLEGMNIDRRTDIFALGALAYGMLAGKPLFLRDSVAATYRAILLEPLPEFPAMPSGVEAAIRRALSRDRDSRFAAAAEFANAIESAGTARADDQALAAFVSDAVPQAVTAAELRAETISSEEPAPTIHEPRAAEKRSGRPVLFVAMALAVVAIALFFAFRHRSAPVVVAPPAPDAAVAVAIVSAAPEPVVTPQIAPSAAPTASARIVRGRLGRDRPPAPSVVTVAETTAPPPEPPHKGSLSVWSNPWGKVWVDGHSLGDSPISRYELPAGTHEVHVVTERGEQTRSVSVLPDQDANARFVF